MKKILSLILTLALAITLTACGNTNSTGQAETSAAPASMPPTVEESENTEENTESNDIEQDTLESETKPTDEPEETGNRILVAYFSRTGENYSVGYIEKGNTHIIADMIAEQTGGDTFEISTVTPYPDDYARWCPSGCRIHHKSQMP